jgi:hypothetical protein
MRPWASTSSSWVPKLAREDLAAAVEVGQALLVEQWRCGQQLQPHDALAHRLLDLLAELARQQFGRPVVGLAQAAHRVGGHRQRQQQQRQHRQPEQAPQVLRHRDAWRAAVHVPAESHARTRS